MKVGFLFNHDALHQISHTAPIIAELVAAGVDVSVFTSSPEQEKRVRHLIPSDMPVHFVRLTTSRLVEVVNAIALGVIPFRRLAILRQNVPVFASLDALVVPETTSTLLKRRYALNNLKLIYLPHGAGDRSVGFRAVTRLFDFVLLPGNKVRDRMLRGELITSDNHAVIGYPKFDTIAFDQVPRIFDNGRPTVLYNPHFDPLLSSWGKMGEEVLDYFSQQDTFNLIFAPHVMLFQRRLHASLEHRRMRLRKAIPRRFTDLPHIRIDTGSTMSTDMSYTRAADIYLGDVSSQVYEWIYNPRPCIFINSHNASWQGNPSYAHWSLGEVINKVSDLPGALERASADSGRFADLQAKAFKETFCMSGTQSSRRAAEAIKRFLTMPSAA
ncbi:hypothetical protein JUN65_16915 [Gluconacetobacter azotocaptans]|uniref:hypothetical protein n=1 Tax=Gluconacetobacter azotocaptans TaxID=142834 RepID=UPI00195797CB|nr:hypothetical protein [Gluconacetobacter azotocaptans]MBM9403257.1 hypothetical protein [Gluconacetobacter azotocaptans]